MTGKLGNTSNSISSTNKECLVSLSTPRSSILMPLSCIHSGPVLSSAMGLGDPGRVAMEANKQPQGCMPLLLLGLHVWRCQFKDFSLLLLLLKGALSVERM